MRSAHGWMEVKGPRARGDERILGDSDFVLRILDEAKEHYERTTLLKSKGYTVEGISRDVAELYGLRPGDVLSKGRQAARVEARSLFCYLAATRLNTPGVDLARLLGMAPSAITYAVKRGERIAREKEEAGQGFLKY